MYRIDFTLRSPFTGGYLDYIVRKGSKLMHI